METVSCTLCTHLACAGQFTSPGGLPLCWDCKKTEGMTGWVVLSVEPSNASGGVYLSGRNMDSADRLFRAFRWDMSTALNDSRYDFTKARVAPEARVRFDRLRKATP